MIDGNNILSDKYTMSRILLIGDSHLNKIDDAHLAFPLTIYARSGLKVRQVENTIFHQESHIFIILSRGNDIHNIKWKIRIQSLRIRHAGKLSVVKLSIKSIAD